MERRRIPRVAAVVLTGVVALGALGGAVLVVGRQLTALADRLPDYETNILRKVKRLTPTGESAFGKLPWSSATWPRASTNLSSSGMT